MITLTHLKFVFINLYAFKNMHHHFKSLGGWTFAFQSYYELNITGNLDTPGIKALQRIVDPICMFYVCLQVIKN